MTSKGIELVNVLELIGHISISFLPMAVPLSALFAAIYTMNKLSEDSELVAMRSFGLSKRTLITPFIVLSFLIASVIFVLNANLIPHSKTQFKNTLIKLTSRGLSADIKPGQFYTEISNVTLFAEKVSAGATKLEGIFILLNKDGTEQVIAAKKGALIKQDLGDLRTPMLRLHLQNGNISKIYDNGKVEKIIFDQYDFPIVSGGNLPGFVSKDSMKSSTFLKTEIESKENELRSIQDKDSGKFRQIKGSLPRSKLELWGRVNTPIQVVIFVLLGFCLGIKRGRGRSKSSGWTGFAILLGYYTIFFLGLSLAKKGIVPAYLSVFTPTVIASFLTVYYYKRVDWQS
jgi:lipopolysaccharide export system permease protein